MKRIILLGMMLVLFTACGSQEARVECKQQIVVEYGEELQDSDVIDAKQIEEGVTMKTVEQFDQWQIGEQTVEITFIDKQERIKKIEMMITVQDSRPPEIVLEKELWEITAGEGVILAQNIVSVKDPVDGDVIVTEQLGEQGGYRLDQGDFNSDVAGSYNIKVIAQDRNGNVVEKEFVVKVNARVEEKVEIHFQSENPHNKTSTPRTEMTENTMPVKKEDAKINTEIPTDSEKKEIVESSDQTVCESNFLPSQVGNSGMLFKTMKDADDWAENQVFDENNIWWMKGWYVTTAVDQCNHDNWYTIGFY